MLKRFLNKKMGPFLDIAFPENILSHLRVANKTKKLLSKKKVFQLQSNFQGTALKSQSSALQKIQNQIIRQFGEGSASKITYPLYYLFSVHQLRNEITRNQASFKKYSEFKLQLKERRKLSVFFGNLSKRDLARAIKKLDFYKGKANENLLMLLETRLDIALQRCCFFASILSARQAVNHGKISVNGKIITSPSYQLHPGDVISSLKKEHSFNKTEENTKEVEQNSNLLSFSPLLGEKEEKKSINKNFVKENLLQNEVEFLKNKKQYFKTRGYWRFVVSPFLMQCLSITHLFKTLIPSTKVEKIEFQKNKKSELCLEKKGKGTCVSNLKKTCVLSRELKEDKDDCFTFYSFLNLFSSNLHRVHAISRTQFLDVYKALSIKEKTRLGVNNSIWRKNPFFSCSGEYGKVICKDFLQKLSHTILNITKKRTGIENCSKRSFFGKNVNLYNFFLYLLLKQKHLHFSYPLPKKMKALHFEISHRSSTAIFLYWPQKLYYPATLDLDLIRKSFK